MFATADMVTYVSLIVGSLLYDAFLRQKSLYLIITTTNFVAFALIIFRNMFITQRLDMDANWFLILNCFVGAVVGQIAFLPFAIISAKLAPKNLESTAYAFFMAFANFSGIISRELSGLLVTAYKINNVFNFDKKDIDSFYALCIILDLIGLGALLLYIHPFTLDSTYANMTHHEKEADNSDSDSQKHDLHENQESSEASVEMTEQQIQVLL